ncbi:MAG: hypothetical protein H2038_04020 [Brevundimonas sp.]|jgi:hypothetical protein|uniref:DUF6491 family protein n=1 Tax=Brevundimonas sp. TaxID=1871086 RepID=UPI001803BC32|nr:DUF6491 family protein [Brevundimonas sp.]MBA4803802.1 hypothetical protein [Brevundimonas sp.]
MRVSLLVGLGLSAALGACAPTTPPAGTQMAGAPRQCFSIQQVENFRQGRSDQVFIRVARDDVYELNGAGCFDLDAAIQLSLVPEGAGATGTRLCTGDWARAVVPGATSARSTCRVRIARKLTPEEIAALPAAHRP